MGYTKARVAEIRLDANGNLEALIACPASAVPLAGQYLLVSDADASDAALGVQLFLVEKSPPGFWSASPMLAAWKPGTNLHLAGPMGHGFDLPDYIQRLALVELGESISRLLPLIRTAFRAQRSLTLFTDLQLPSLPAALEIFPLASVGDALDWPDFMVVDLPLGRLTGLRKMLTLSEGARLAFPAQVLVTTPMPCAGMARCGACAVPARRGWVLACEDGPVFDLNTLKW